VPPLWCSPAHSVFDDENEPDNAGQSVEMALQTLKGVAKVAVGLITEQGWSLNGPFKRGRR
jgi:exo-beta-1,3-glucanase (GH17 family)